MRRLLRALAAFAVVTSGSAGCAHGSGQGDRLARAEAPPEASALPEADHPVLAAYRVGLESWLPEAALERLSALDRSDTLDGDPERLRFLAADRIVRQTLPLCLEGSNDPALEAHARRLRALPPMLNRDIDFVHARAVREAMQALEAHRRGGAVAGPSPAAEGPGAEGPGAAKAQIEAGSHAEPGIEALLSGGQGDFDADAEAEYAEAQIEYARTYARLRGVSSLEARAAAAAASDAIDVALFMRRAVQEYGVAPEQITEQALGLYEEMADAARRRERLPQIRRAAQPPPDPGAQGPNPSPADEAAASPSP